MRLSANSLVETLMRKQNRLTLKKLVAQAMTAEMPEFASAKISSPFVGTQEFVFRRAVNDIHHFIVFVPKAGEGESFTVELAWSRRSRFPELGMRPSLRPTQVGDERGAEEGSVRLRELVGGKDIWWDAIPLDASDPASVQKYMAFQMQPLDEATAEFLLAPLVRDAMHTIVDHGIAYLDGIGSDDR